MNSKPIFTNNLWNGFNWLLAALAFLGVGGLLLWRRTKFS